VNIQVKGLVCYNPRMSYWFFLALAAPILWSLTNHIDKYLLSKYLPERGAGILLVFSALSSAIVLPPIAWIYRGEIFNVSSGNLATLLFVGLASAVGLYLYLICLEREEASVVIPLFQLIPVFGYVLGYLVLKETLSVPQILSSLLVILGVVILSVDITKGKRLSLKGRALLLISASSFLYALYDTLFKLVALTENFWISIFWQAAALASLGGLMLVVNVSVRDTFFKICRDMGGKILSLNLVNEVIYTIGSLLHSFATLLAPIALVLVVSGLQPLFVFIGGIVLTLFLPAFSKEEIGVRFLAHRLISITIITVGSYFLYMSL